jgi:hypothetical protein
MQAVDMVLQAHEISWIKRKFCMTRFAAKHFPWTHSRVRSLHFFKSWLNPQRASLPENIKWENLGYSRTNRLLRKTIVWCFAILLIIISLVGISLFKMKTDELSKEFKIDVRCPENILSLKKEAYED